MRWLIYVCTPANLRINYLQSCPYWVMKLLSEQNNCSPSVIYLLCLFLKKASVAVLVPRSTCNWTGLVYCCCLCLLVFNVSWNIKLQKTSIKVYEKLYEVIWQGKVIPKETHYVNLNTEKLDRKDQCVMFCFGVNMQWESFFWHK